jgi:hypothetical protein
MSVSVPAVLRVRIWLVGRDAVGPPDCHQARLREGGVVGREGGDREAANDVAVDRDDVLAGRLARGADDVARMAEVRRVEQHPASAAALPDLHEDEDAGRGRPRNALRHAWLHASGASRLRHVPPSTTRSLPLLFA